MEESKEAHYAEVLQKKEQRAILCPKNNDALQLCISKGCENCAISCVRKDCQCLAAHHQKCDFTMIENFQMQSLSKKKQLSGEHRKALDALDGIYDQLLQKISLQKQELRIFREYFGINIYQAKVMNYLASGQISQLTGDLVSKTRTEVNIDYNNLGQPQILNFWQQSYTVASEILAKLKNTLYPNQLNHNIQDIAPIGWGTQNQNAKLQVYGRILIHKDTQLAIKPTSFNFTKDSKKFFWGFKVLKIQGNIYFGVSSLQKLIKSNWKEIMAPYIENHHSNRQKNFALEKNDCIYVRYYPSTDQITFINSRSNHKYAEKVEKLSDYDYYCPYVGLDNHSVIQIIEQIPKGLNW